MRSPKPSERQLRGVTFVVAGVLAFLLVVTAAGVLARTSSGGTNAKVRPVWTWSPPMPHRRSYTASTEIGGKIYVAAGMVGNSGRPLDLFERFDPKTDRWSSLTPLPHEFSAAAGAKLGQTFYVIGGNSPEVDGRQVYAYDTRRGSWRTLTPLPAPRTNLAAVGLGNKLYAIGGLDPVNPVQTVYAYDVARETWSEVAPLPEAIHAMAATVFKGEIWVLGGRLQEPGDHPPRLDLQPRAERVARRPVDAGADGPPRGRIRRQQDPRSARVEVLRLRRRDRKWRRGPSLKVPRHALALYAVGGKLFAIGGCIVPQLEDSPAVETLRLTG